MGWWDILQLGGGIFAGGFLNWLFARRSSKELRREAERLRGLTLKLIRILDGADLIEVSEWDAETGEPYRWPVGSSRTVRYSVEAPTPRWKRVWRRMFGS
jgi:hypothetical protein